MDEKEIFEICMGVDSFIAAELTESIVRGTSYDMLEAHYGILPISKSHFYRKKRNGKYVDTAEDDASGGREERAVENGVGENIKRFCVLTVMVV